VLGEMGRTSEDAMVLAVSGGRDYGLFHYPYDR
jgi:hypothetical protein